MNIIDNNGLLTQQQIIDLQNEVTKPFRLARFQSLDDILKELNVDVIIEPGRPQSTMHFYLNEAKKFWEEKKREIREQLRDENREAGRNLGNEVEEAQKNVRIIEEELDAWNSMLLLGLYVPSNNNIRLFPENMAQEYGVSMMAELLLSTLAHETMHAYFDRPRHRSHPYVLFIEEPLAEFGMLLYLFDTNSSFYQWAYEDVSSKRTCYRFGAMLMDQHLQDNNNPSYNRAYLEKYKIRLDKYTMPDISWDRSSYKLP